ncbi:soma ferritin-like isoform X2 [Homarus americanus]|uniref:soma ferritin-like isoform X2 n=1 Tax=Homarus americanus TaxID=6706 RepID=UPI001C43EF3E|nr:soma ferritin-like isoform X2 [Homarus americanus]
MASAIRQNYHEESEAAINKHINLELHASYTFLSMGYHFERDDVALPGLSKFFKDHSDFELDNAQTLMKYQNQRGGRVVLQAIPAPCQQEWGQGMEALQVALDLKKQINKYSTQKNSRDVGLSVFERVVSLSGRCAPIIPATGDTNVLLYCIPG